jgi:hypothetical protein
MRVRSFRVFVFSERVAYPIYLVTSDGLRRLFFGSAACGGTDVTSVTIIFLVANDSQHATPGRPASCTPCPAAVEAA